jgi:uncharacterized protein YkwD
MPQLPLHRLILVLGATVAIGLAAPAAAMALCQGANARPATASPRALASATVCLINHERQRRGLRRLASNRRLSRAALSHTIDMVEHRYFSHVSKVGLGPIDRLRAAGYLRQARRWAVGENLAWGIGGLGTPRAMVAGWMTSPGHRRNILNRSFGEIGVGAVTLRSAAAYTADFAYRR